MSNIIAGEEVTILVAEDDREQMELIREYFERMGLHNPMLWFPGCLELMEYVEGPEFEDSCAYMVLIDVVMPSVDCVETLERLKKHEKTRNIPVIMINGAVDRNCAAECVAPGYDYFLAKPISFKNFAAVLHRVGLGLVVVKVMRHGGE